MLDLGMLKEINGLRSECGSYKIPLFFGPAYFAVCNAVVSLLSFNYKASAAASQCLW